MCGVTMTQPYNSTSSSTPAPGTTGTINWFYDFCGGVPFWDEAQLNQRLPVFSTCFLETVLVWFPAAYLWLATPWFLAYLYSGRRAAPLPCSALHVAKVVVSCLLLCMTVLGVILQEHYGYSCSAATDVPTAAYTATGIQFATLTLTVLLQQVQRLRGLKTSAVPFCFWLLLLLCEILPLYSRVITQSVCGEDIVYYVYFVLICVQLVLHCVAEQYSNHGYKELDNQNPCPDESASILSHISFHWLTPLIWQSYRRTFVEAQFWSQTSRLRSDLLAPLLEDEWKREQKRCQVARCVNQKIHYKVQNGQLTQTSANGHPGQRSGRGHATETSRLLDNSSHKDEAKHDVSGVEASLFKAIFRVFIVDWMEATAYMGLAEIFWFGQPLLLRYIIQLIEQGDAVGGDVTRHEAAGYNVAGNETTGNETLGYEAAGYEAAGYNAAWRGVLYSVLLFMTLSANTFLYHISYHHMLTLGLKVKTALICLIYKKALTLKRSGTRATSTVGEIVTLMSVDCQRIQDAFNFSFIAVLIFLILTIATVLLWSIMGVASLGCLGVIFITLLTVCLIAREQYKIQNALLYLKGDRINIINEVISGIKVLKMYAWEPSFIKKVQNIRNQELKLLWRYAVLSATTILFAIHSPFMMNFVLVLIYVLTSPTHTLRAEETFTALSVVNILRYSIAFCPFLVNGAVQASVSIGRIEEFLRMDDLDTDSVNVVKSAEHAVAIEDGDFTWNTDSPEPVLNNISMRVREGELVAVVGQVGSGKSSLMAACLGEMVRLRGTVTLKGKVAYVPQEAWIQNMTLRDNILFSKRYNSRKYDKVLDACALLPDLKILAGGDMTEIGEKGINISGGQKQRVSLARAVYNNADVYFLDDPLSAVDSHVGKHLFKKVVGNEGLLRHKTRILVTHGIHWLPMVDRIFVLSGGTISETGTYDELISRDGDFATFLHHYLQQDDDAGEHDPEIQRVKDEMRSKVEELKSDGGMTSEEDLVSTRGRRGRQSTSSNVVSYRRQRSEGSKPAANTDVTKAAANTDVSRLTADETSQEGAIKPAVLLTFLKAMGYVSVIIVFLCISTFQALNIFSNFWLTYWTEDPLLLNITLSDTAQYEQRYLYYLFVYLILGVVQGVVVFVGFYLALTRMVRASGRLHNRMLISILRSPMAFFDTTPIGRMMNRFSSDVDIMDNKLPESFRLWTIMVFSIAAVLIVVSITTPIFIAAIVPIAAFYVFCVKFYLPTARSMRRTESVHRSPIYNHFSETLTGAAVIRAFRCSARFVQESRSRLDTNIKFYYAANTGARWIGIRLEIIGNLIAFLATVFALISEELSGAQVGLSITYAVQMTVTLNFVVLAISEMEMNIVSAERVTEYTDLPTEAGWVLSGTKPDGDWPRSGRVEFADLTTRYRPGLDLVLKGITCTISDGEKVGIVGRTGAGKSSLTLCLFRLIEAAGGRLLVDGVDVSRLGLHHLRSRLTILPQDPVIFSGSLRANLDPFCRHDDASVWHALECAHLRDFTRALPQGLEYECGEGGQNLSVGQRQLVCLARTLLHKTRVLILDEATAAVDMETDDLIQDTIRSQFRECTIITVAHRLNTILDYDRVMVLDEGVIREFASPQSLLQDEHGLFYGMARDAGLV